MKLQSTLFRKYAGSGVRLGKGENTLSTQEYRMVSSHPLFLYDLAQGYVRTLGEDETEKSSPEELKGEKPASEAPKPKMSTSEEYGIEPL